SGYLEAYADRSAKARRQFPCSEDVRYGASRAQVFDFFPAMQEEAPLFVFVHGGYWQELSQKESAPMAAQVLAAGFAFATLNYTLAPEGTIESNVREVSRALAFLQENASDLGFDRSRMTLSGHSAGAHLAAMQIALEHPPFDPRGLERLLLISGIFDLDPIPLTSINDLLGLDAERAHALSPMFLAPNTRRRVTVAVAERDTEEFRRQSKDYALHLVRHGLDANYI